jgi:hypothetical protein
MTEDRYPLPGQPAQPGPAARLPEPVAEPSADRARTRRDGLKRVRHMSNWTAAALLVGTGAATVALASHALPATASTSTSSYATQGTPAPGVHAPHVGGPVATSGGSGATVTTTTHVVNGKTVVTQVRHPAVYHDH